MVSNRLAIALCIAASGLGCGSDKENDTNTEGVAEPAQGVDTTDASAGPSAEDAGTRGATVALDAEASADDAARSICALAPFVLAKMPPSALSADKVTNYVRDVVDTFAKDKPPICVDAPDSTKDLCVEMPSEVVTFTYLFRSDGVPATSPVEQVWCKSDSHDDLARLPGWEKATRGTCEELHNVIVDWAKAQLKAPSSRTIQYEASVIERGSMWVPALVEATEEGTVLRVKSPELYAPTKEKYIAEFGSAALPFLGDDFFGNQYCKLISPARALAWLEGG